MKVVLPQKIKKDAYYQIHVKYLIRLFSAMDCDVAFTPKDTSIDNSKFTAVIDNSLVLFDFCDFSCETVNWNHGPYFKFHYDPAIDYAPNIRPFPPVSFYNWERFFQLRSQISYPAEGRISYRQVPYGGAAARRTSLKHKLEATCGNILDTRLLEQEQYWLSINSDFVQVFAPGAREGILDRAQLQCMAFGECTISPRITDMLPARRLLPFIHYIQCADDFSDIEYILSELQKNTDVCKAIGANAKQLFSETCVPLIVRAYVEYVLHA